MNITIIGLSPVSLNELRYQATLGNEVTLIEKFDSIGASWKTDSSYKF